MRGVLIDSLINCYPPSSLPSKNGNLFRGTQLIKQQFLPTPNQDYGVGGIAVLVELVTPNS
jgi:hypothetical protein